MKPKKYDVLWNVYDKKWIIVEVNYRRGHNNYWEAWAECLKVRDKNYDDGMNILYPGLLKNKLWTGRLMITI